MAAAALCSLMRVFAALAKRPEEALAMACKNRMKQASPESFRDEQPARTPTKNLMTILG
jgi:hypothetical protein